MTNVLFYVELGHNDDYVLWPFPTSELSTDLNSLRSTEDRITDFFNDFYKDDGVIDVTPINVFTMEDILNYEATR